MKVGIIEPIGGHGGLDYYDLDLCRSLVSSGVNINLYTCDETKISQNLGFIVNLFYKNIYGSRSKYQRGIHYLVGTLKSIIHAKLSHVQILHFHIFCIGYLEFINVILGRLMGFRIVFTVHDVESFDPKLSVTYLNRITHYLSNCIIVHNETCKADLIKYQGVPIGKIQVIPSGNLLNWIDQVPTQLEARGWLNISPDSKVLLFWGQIKPVKGLDILLKALNKIVQEVPGVLLIIAGKVLKDDFNKYQKIIDDYNISNYCVVRLGYIPNDEASFYFSATDLVVLPYQKIYQSAVLLMAMSYGKPVLTSDLPPMKEIITDQETGFLFSRGNIEALSNGIIKILSSNGCYQRVGLNALNMVKKRFDWNEIGLRTAKCYQSLLN